MRVSICTVCRGRREMLERVLPSWRALEPAEIVVASWDGELGLDGVVSVPVTGAFSPGRGRNLAFAASKSDTVLLCDADIELPPDLWRRLMPDLELGLACCPVYRHRLRDGSITGRVSFGSGIVLLRRRMWPEPGFRDKETWGGEDIDFMNRLIVGTGVSRRDPGLVHSWHPRPVSDPFYSTYPPSFRNRIDGVEPAVEVF